MNLADLGQVLSAKTLTGNFYVSSIGNDSAKIGLDESYALQGPLKQELSLIFVEKGCVYYILI